MLESRQGLGGLHGTEGGLGTLALRVQAGEYLVTALGSGREHQWKKKHVTIERNKTR